MRLHSRCIAAGLIAAALLGCADVPPIDLDKPEHLKPLASAPEASRSIYVTAVSTKLVSPKIGQMKGGLLCIGPQQLIWKDSPSVLNAVREQITRTLAKNGYNVSPGLVEDVAKKDADILIGVGIDDLRANMCYSVNGMKGAASLRLRWEVVDQKQNRTFTSTSSGAASIAEFSPSGDPDIFVSAAEMATENLLSQDAFLKATRK